MMNWIFLILGLALCQGPLAQAEVFPLDMGRVGHQSGTLEIATDPDFQDLLVSFSIGDRQEYLVNFPSTRVYYLRARRETKIIWQEALFALVENVPEDRMPRLDWGAVNGALRYRLWLVRDQIRTQWLETPGQAAHLNRIGSPWLIRIRAINALGALQPVPVLNFRWVDSGAKGSVAQEPPPPPKKPEIRIDPNAKDDDQVVYEPDDKDLLSGAEESPMDAFVARVTPRNLSPLKRQHELFVWIRYLQERFEIDKKDRFESDPSSGLGTGLSGQYFLAPNLSITGLIDTHSTKTDYEVGGSQTPEDTQKRIRIHLALGLDFLNTNIRMTDWSLNFGPAFGLLQIPLQENEQKFTDYGVKFDTHHYPTRLAFALLFLKSGSREVDLRWIAPWTAWSIHPFLGFYSYESRQSAGAVTGLFHEKGLRLGLERDF